VKEEKVSQPTVYLSDVLESHKNLHQAVEAPYDDAQFETLDPNSDGMVITHETSKNSRRRVKRNGTHVKHKR